MKKKALITGITGFVGSHLAEYLLARGDVEVYGTIRWRSRTENIDPVKDQVNLIECELRDAISVDNVVREVKPDLIFHLAAQSFVPASWNSPADTLTANTLGQVNIFEALRRHGLTETRIQIACSSEEYGLVHEDEVPIKESNPLRPLSPYAVSKVTQDYLAFQYYRSYGTKAVRTRTFNHTGPRRGHVFVTSNFAKQVAEIEEGLREPVIHVGNLEAKRDFTDVRDAVRAYWLALEKGVPGEVYNVSSDRTIRIRDMLDMLLSMSKLKIRVEVDPARLRPSDVEILYGDSSKFRAQTGWAPTIPFEQTMRDLLNYWREKV